LIKYSELPLDERIQALKDLWKKVNETTLEGKQDIFIKFIELWFDGERKQIANDILKLVECGELPVTLRKAVEDWIFVIDNFKFAKDSFVTFYTCKRCGFRVISIEDAIAHHKVGTILNGGNTVRKQVG